MMMLLKTFVEKLEEYAKMIYDKCEKNPRELTFTDEDEVVYDSAKVCHICEHYSCNQRRIAKMITWLLRTAQRLILKVRDHCYTTGKLRGADT
jgi:hypothetical protein